MLAVPRSSVVTGAATRSLSPLLFLSLHLLVVVLSCLCASPVSAQQPVVTSVSGCTDVGSATWNCSNSGVTLTVYGSGFVPDENAAFILVDRKQLSSGCTINQPISSSTNLTCELSSIDRTFVQGGVLEGFEIAFPSLATPPEYYVGTPLFYGVAWVHTPLPTITRISGCDDSNNADGQYTANCNPDYNILTLTGIDFSMFSEAVTGVPADRVQTVINGVNVGNTPWVLVNSTTIQIPLQDEYSRILVPDHYTARR